MSEELKPCPFCGHDQQYLFTKLNESVQQNIQCKKCGAIVSGVGNEARNIWNTRAHPDPSGVVEALEALLKVWSDIPDVTVQEYPDATVQEYPEGHMVIKARAELKAYKETLLKTVSD